MLEDLIKLMRSLDLLSTELEGDEWCTKADMVLQEAADVIETLNRAMAKSW